MNFGTPVPLLIGIILILGALALFFLDKFKPGYERDSDKVYAVLLLISGLFLLTHLTMDLLPSFQQLIMAGMLTTLLIENIRTRDPNQNPLPGPPMDRRPPRPRYEERPPVQRGYRAELDNRPEFRGQPVPRMNPAQPSYRQDAYANATNPQQVRPPYEEFRGPAGQLQPSRQSRPQNAPQNGPRSVPQNGPQPRPQPGLQNGRPSGGSPVGGPPDNRYSDNSRYGERPPAPNRTRQRPPEGPVQAPPPNAFGRPDESGRSSQSFSPNAPEIPREAQRPAGQPRPNETVDGLEAGGARRSDIGERNNGERDNGNSRQSPRENSVENSGSPARALDVRPLSEAPNFDDEYRTNN